ncbi:MAG: sigma-54-dependent Fis family transcriptional regulator [Desulfarculus sp.]|nr:sigma-54-dependent Fis family transcriptional regulator [Desulfarculus sp.]
MPFKPRILIVEDDAVARRNLQHILEKGGEYQIEPAGGGAEALQKLARGSYHLVMTDLRMEKVDGMAVLAEVRSRHPDTEVIMLTAYASVDSAIEAMKLGAFHYIAKPYKIDEVRAQVAHALEKSRLKEELHQLRSELKARDGLGLVLGKNANILKLVRTLGQIAPTDCNVLISGETGTGKEVFARAVHYASPRAGGRFMAFNCGAFTEELLASELFGHERGAFTGAVATKRGLFEAADGGTIFLDEIGDMPTPMQVKLLRVIQEKVVLRVGGTEPVNVDVRIVAATHQDLKKLVEQGRFRSDLFYRLNVVSLNVPPLRERKDDIPLLATHFLQKYAAQQNRNIRGISQEMMRALSGYHFPGNVRELENIIERAVALSTGEVLEVKDLPDDLKETSLAGGGPEGGLPSLEEKERQYILWVLAQTRGNRTKAAEILGVDRVSLWRKLKRYGMEQ